MRDRRMFWEGVAIGVVVSTLLTLLFPPDTFSRFAPVIVPAAVLVLVVLFWRARSPR